VKEAKNFDVSLRLSYFVNDQIVAMNQPSNVGSALKDILDQMASSQNVCAVIADLREMSAFED
jgi:hypothetical protein